MRRMGEKGVSKCLVSPEYLEATTAAKRAGIYGDVHTAEMEEYASPNNIAATFEVLPLLGW